jgi:hypothetical protein
VAIGLTTLRFAKRAVSVLQGSPWGTTGFETRLVRGYRSTTRKITLAAIESDDITLYAAPWRMKYLHRSPSKTLWVAEDPTGKNLVLTPDGGVNLFRASRPGP